MPGTAASHAGGAALRTTVLGNGVAAESDEDEPAP